MTSSPVTAAHVEPGMLHAVNILTLLTHVPDPRCRRGRRHRLEVILALAVAAGTAGAESLTGIWDWAQDFVPALLRGLQMPALIPSETTIRRVLEACDPVMFNLLLGAWMRRHLTGRGQVVAVDGKTLRRSGGTEGRLPHLISVRRTLGDMAPDTATLIRDALALDADQRAVVVGALLDSLHDAGDAGDVDAAWQAEVTRRLSDIRAGAVELVDADEHYAGLRASLTA